MFSAKCVLRFEPIADKKNIVYASLQDLWSQVPLTLTFLIAKFFLRKFCFEPLGRKLKISDSKRKSLPPNDVLETIYRKSTKNPDLSSIAKKVEMSERQVERWWRLRRSQDKPSTLVKFTENMWKFTFYLCNFTFGLYVLWDKEWLWDMDKTIKNINAGITSDIWWYYMVSSAFYWSLTLTQFWDVRRKDFWQMFVHHLATIALFSFSWVANFYRIGSIVLLLHDVSDIALELGKAAKYARLRSTTAIFVLFTLTWIIARLILFPYWVLTRMTEQAFVCDLPVVRLLTVMLWLLLVLHVIWTWMILQVMYKTATSGQEPEDLRSSSSESEQESKIKNN